MELTKSDLRTHLRTIRHQPSEEEYLLECRKILMQSIDIPELIHARTILSYWPKLEAREIDIRSLNCWLRAKGTTVLLPVTEPNSKTLRMKWGQFQDERSLTMNRWGIAEPPISTELLAQDVDVVLVPGLGFDFQGNRIGYGGGFYDQMFEHIQAYKIGLVMKSCLVKTIPNESHDVPVDLIVTSNTTIQITPS